MMRALTLEVRGFRGIKALRLDLDEQLNVFVGTNGTGKSAVLDSTAILLSWMVGRIGSEKGAGRRIVDTDINNNSRSSNLSIACESAGELLSWSLAKGRRGRALHGSRSRLAELTALADHFRELMTTTEGEANLPLFAYYPVHRAVLDIPLRIRTKHNFNLMSAFDDSLTSGSNFRTFFEWFREREDYENEKLARYKGNKSKKFADRQLNAVRRAIAQFMPDFENLGVHRNPLRMEVEKSGQTLTVNQLSDGEKCLMAMVGDLARRMAIANPTRKNPLDGSGIVMIDEIDLHLHPKWQRMMIPNLMEVFPSCQFLISTHSPHVITHVHPSSLFMLRATAEGIEVDRPNESYGKSVERILEDLMGLETTRPRNIASNLRKLFQLIETNKLGRAKELISQIKDEIGQDPELVRASVLIRRKELIGK